MNGATRRLPGLFAGAALAAVLAGRAGAQVPGAVPTARQAAALSVSVSADTILFPGEERLPIGVRVGRAARFVAVLLPAEGGGSAVWRSDTVPSGRADGLAWDLRVAGGRVVETGRYTLRVTALDTAGPATSVEVVLVITRLPADTQPPPLPLASSEILPETLVVGQTTPWAIFIGTAIAVLPRLMGRGALNDGLPGDGRALAVAASVTAAGFVAFFAGRHPEFSRENARLNAERRSEYEEHRASIEAANARAREAPPIRVQRERGGP